MPTPLLLLLDGGLGTTVESLPHALPHSTPTPLWSSHLLITSPSTLVQAHKSFISAGADIILTATYQSSVSGFRATKIASSDDGPDEEIGDEEAESYMRSAVSLARSAIASSASDGKARERRSVALSLGAYGATMRPSTEYSGLYPPEMLTVEGLREWHESRLNIFKHDDKTWKDIDYIAFETLPRVEEVRAVRQVMRGADKKWWISCVFPGSEAELPDGTNAEACIEAILGGEGPNPWGIGVNCTEVGKLPELVLRFEKAVGKILGKGEWPWLVMYPDGAKGEVYNTSTQMWERKEGGDSGDWSGKEWSEDVLEILGKARREGLWSGILVGGCCKTTAEDIGKLRVGIDELVAKDERDVPGSIT